jgi:hypothetical protein
MKRSLGNLLLASLAVFILAGFAIAPFAEAAVGGGRGGDRGGGGGGDRQAARVDNSRAAKVDNSRADVRTNDVRNTSVNNVNAQRNVNVNVQGQSGCCGGGWDNDYHPVATAAAIGATAAIVGSIVRTPPPGCVPVNYGGMVYQQCGNTWYQPQGSQFVVVNPPY